MLTSGTKAGSNDQMMNDGRNLRGAVSTEEGWAITQRKMYYLEGFSSSRNGVRLSM